MNFIRRKIYPWLTLFRVPNLFTVPGDPIAGCAIFGGESMYPLLPFAVGASLCFYCFGLVSNDIADLRTDMLERPRRPLPSGVISVKAATVAALLLAAAGILMCSLIGVNAIVMGFVLLSSIILYNFRFKNSDLTGACLLGLCRVLSLMLGTAVGRGYQINTFLFASLVISYFLYIVGVSMVAKEEMNLGKPRKGLLAAGAFLFSFSPVAWLVLGFGSVLNVVYMCGEVPPAIVLAAIIALIFIARTFMSLWGVLFFGREQLPAQIGILIRSVILIQASACAFAGFSDIAILILLLYLPAGILGRIFHGS